MSIIEIFEQVVEEAQASHHASQQIERAAKMREFAAILLINAAILESEALTLAYEQIGDPREAV